MSDREGVVQISVVIPVWNRPDDIRRCLASLMDQTLSRDQYEIIVVDNGSSDDTPDVARAFPGVTVLSEPRPGSYAARNRGLEAARGRYVAFIDSDCIADGGWLERGLEAMHADPRPGIAAGQIRFSDDDEGGSAVCAAYERLFSFKQAKNVADGRAVTANWISPTALLREAGGFRADLKSGGDFDLSRRIRESGYPIVYVSEAIVVHPARSSWAELSAKARRVTGGKLGSLASRSTPAWMLKAVRDTYMRGRQVWGPSSRLPVGMKLRLSVLLMGLLAVTMAEIVRLGFGMEARRA